MNLFVLAQSPSPGPGGLNGSDIFYLGLIFIFLTAIVTTLLTKLARDKCLNRLPLAPMFTGNGKNNEHTAELNCP